MGGPEPWAHLVRTGVSPSGERRVEPSPWLQVAAQGPERWTGAGVVGGHVPSFSVNWRNPRPAGPGLTVGQKGGRVGCRGREELTEAPGPTCLARSLMDDRVPRWLCFYCVFTSQHRPPWSWLGEW